MRAEQNKLTKQNSLVVIDESLNQLSNKILFAKKLEKANKMLKTAKLPTKK